jgi:NAD(P)-dependent dehydrogenase (short-subunit alcohol dehydrogenase family)
VLRDKVALVTAGSKKLGKAIATALAGRGAQVAVNYRDSGNEAGALVADLKRHHGGSHLAVPGDVSERAQVEAMVATVEQSLGPVQIMVNNAGPFSRTPFLDMEVEEWDRIIDSNLKAVYLCTRTVAHGMRDAGWGRVVNISAVSAFVRNRSVYGLAKLAINNLTEELALELGPSITVNSLAPGQIEESLAEMAGFDPTWAKQVVDATPLGRLVTRSEIGELVATICTPVFDMITGVVIPVDGGLRLTRF